MRRRTPLFCSNFYPRPPRGGRPALRLAAKLLSRFLPTPSTRRATGGGAVQQPGHLEFLPTPSTRRATRSPSLMVVMFAFLPTPSTRRATGSAVLQPPPLFDFYPRPPRGGRHGNGSLPTAPDTHFYPRPPRGGRPDSDSRLKAHVHISTHALHEEGDILRPCAAPFSCYFYPRPPRGGRLTRTLLWIGRDQFLPTPSTRRATVCPASSPNSQRISTHALHEEGDVIWFFGAVAWSYFYPRPPRGGRPS